MFTFDLNRRHRVGIFFLLVATGLSLFFEASAKQTVGIAFLGVATTWLIGSLSLRALGIIGCILVSALGLLIGALPVYEEWVDYVGRSKGYEMAVSELKEAIAKAPVWGIVPPEKQSNAFNTLPRDFVDKQEIARKPLSSMSPDFIPDQQEADTKVVAIPESAQAWERRFTVSASGEILLPGGSKEVIRRTEQNAGLVGKILADPEFKKLSPEAQQLVLEKYGGRVYSSKELTLQEIVSTPEFKGVSKEVKNYIFAEYGIRTISEGTETIVIWSAIPFAGSKSDQDIMLYFQTNILSPRPSFSLWNAVRTHWKFALLGFILAAAGTLGCVWLTHVALRAKRFRAPTPA
ncbi:MAG: hypothetical protein HY046_00135 [Acidobacteria bacterium]|nr:hypothetical protein [Acidobacteriota bacterium]